MKAPIISGEKTFKTVLFIDPGVHNPITGVDSLGNFYKVNPNDVAELFWLKSLVRQKQSIFDQKYNQEHSEEMKEFVTARSKWLQACILFKFCFQKKKKLGF